MEKWLKWTLPPLIAFLAVLTVATVAGDKADAAAAERRTCERRYNELVELRRVRAAVPVGAFDAQRAANYAIERWETDYGRQGVPVEDMNWAAFKGVTAEEYCR